VSNHRLSLSCQAPNARKDAVLQARARSAGAKMCANVQPDSAGEGLTEDPLRGTPHEGRGAAVRARTGRVGARRTDTS